MNVFGFRLALPMFDDTGGGAGAPAGNLAPAGPPAGNPGGNSGAASPGAPAGVTPPAAPPAAPAYTYKEDRSNWVPSHRIRQESERAAKLERDLEHERNRVAALSGVKREAAPDPERDGIREQLFRVAPELKELFEFKDMLGELKGLNVKETLETLRNSHNQSWVQRGNQTLTALQENVREVYGAAGKDLSAKAMQRIQRSFITELEEDPEMKARYEAGDDSVVSDFVKDFTGGLLDPYRRSTASVPANREAARRLPRGGGGQAVAGPPARTVKPSDGDAFHKSAFARFEQG